MGSIPSRSERGKKFSTAKSMAFGMFGSLLHICRKTLSHASLFMRFHASSKHVCEANIWLRRFFPPMSSNNNRVSHLLPIPETETCPQTGDGGDGVEGLLPGCLSMGASKTMSDTKKSFHQQKHIFNTMGTHNLTFIFWGVYEL